MWVPLMTPLLLALLLSTTVEGGRSGLQDAGHARRLAQSDSNPDFPSTEFPPTTMNNLANTEESCNLGCYTDSFDKRALLRYLYKEDNTMTVEDCHGAAIMKNYSLYALQFRRECWVGKNIVRAVQYGPSRDCNQTCPGNSSELCGGWLAFNLYSRGPCSPPPSPSPPPPPPPSPPPPSPPPPSAVETCYMGCYADTFEARAMETELFHNSGTMSVEACHDAANKKNYNLFGLTYGQQCWGSNLPYQATSHGLSTSCNMTCPGNANEGCGGWLAFNLYSRGACTPPPPPNSAASPPPNPTPPLPPPPEPSCDLGCYADSFTSRAATLLYKQSHTMTVETCHSAAMTKGFHYFALQYGQECWGSNDATTLLQYGPSTACNMTCAGNAAEQCGGWLAMNVQSRGTCA